MDSVQKGMTLGILLLLSIPVSAQEPEGKLRIYERATQIGTVASREFKDDKGRLVKVIYYSHADTTTNDFREQSTRTFDYDEYGCPIKSGSYDRTSKLTRTDEVRCVEGTATPSLTIVRNALGIKHGEIRHTATGGTQTALQFDNTGETADPCGVPRSRGCWVPSACCSGAVSHRRTYSSTQS